MTGNTDQNTGFPLCVDCDGTLIKTDILFESVLKLLAVNPLKIFNVIVWVLQGKKFLKEKLVANVKISVSSLPYNPAVLKYIKQKKDAGHNIVLVTASHQDNAEEIASFLNIFDHVFGTSKTVNLKGRNKANFLTDKFGAGGFDYMGDSNADLAIWEKSRKAILIGNTPFLHARLKNINNNIERIPMNTNGLMMYLKLIRIHQWAKNMILFIPLLTSHSFLHIPNGIIAFFSFSFVASATYIINDLVDLENDRAHHSKKRRPIAAGNISIPTAISLSILLMAVGVGILFFINNIMFTLLVAGYIVMTLAYSFILKKKLLIDTIVLSLLYCIRLLAGHIAMDVPLSFWLLSFSIFFFFSLALAKRYMEISHSVKSEIIGKIKGRGYEENDLLPIGILGISAGMLSVAIFSIYLQSERVMSLYKAPMLLVLLIPIFLYWISRLWILAYRGFLNEDPVVFALKDKTSYLLLIIILFVILTATSFTL